MIAIATHDHADFDAFAAMVAAPRLYGGGKLVLGRPVAKHVHALLWVHKDHFDLCQERDLYLDAIDKLAIVDTPDLRRLRSIPQLVARIRAGTHQVKVDIWDHHRASADDLVGDVVHVEPVGATTTRIVEGRRARRHVRALRGPWSAPRGDWPRGYSVDGCRCVDAPRWRRSSRRGRCDPKQHRLERGATKGGGPARGSTSVAGART